MTADLAPIPVIDGQLEIPTIVVIPETLEDAHHQLAALDGLATATEWARSAIVAAYVDLPGKGRSTDLYSVHDFAALGLAGLKSAVTVTRYRRAWGARPRPVPGEAVGLPAEPFPAVGGAHVSNNTGENEWYTPPEIIDAARRVLGHIALDPASSDVAQRTVGASVFFTAADDGLSEDWFGPVWLNPPYSQPLIGQFIDKLCRADVEAITLVNNATETEWGSQLLRSASAVCFPAGRIRFLDPDGNPGGAPLQGQMIAYIGPEPGWFAEVFDTFGPVLAR